MGKEIMRFLSSHLGQRPNGLGGQETSPSTPIYSGEAHGSYTRSSGTALPLFLLLLSHGAWRSPARLPRSSTTTTPLCCCWMESSSTSPSLLAGSRRGRRHRAVRVLNAEVPSVRHSVIGDLDHGEYDSIIPVHLNASARDLQGYVDALLSPRC